MSHKWEIIENDLFIFVENLVAPEKIGAYTRNHYLVNQPTICVASGTYEEKWSNYHSKDNIKTNHWARYLLPNPELCYMTVDDQVNWLVATYNSYRSINQKKLIGIKS